MWMKKEMVTSGDAMMGMCPQSQARGTVWKSLAWFDSEAGQEARSRPVPGRHLWGAHLGGNSPTTTWRRCEQSYPGLDSDHPK